LKPHNRVEPQLHIALKCSFLGTREYSFLKYFSCAKVSEILLYFAK
jgi:hypothetical protein